MICCLSTQTTYYARRQKLSQNSSQSVSRAVMKLVSPITLRSLSLSFNPLMNIWFVFICLFACGFAFYGCVWLWETSECFVSQQHHVIISVICLFHVCIVIFKGLSGQECWFVCTTSDFIPLSLTKHNS